MRLVWVLSLLAATVAGACSTSTPEAMPPASGTGGGNGSGGSNGSGGNGTGGDTPTPDAGNGSGGSMRQDTGSAPVVDAQDAVTVPDAGPGDGGNVVGGSNRVLIYTKTTGQRHDSIPVAADYIGRAARAAGLVTETSEDITKFTPAGLAPYGAVVLLATTGEPFGSGATGTAGIAALAAWLKAGGALIGIENATHAYDTSDIYVGLLGGDFIGHPGDYTTATCTKEGDHPSVAMLPASFRVTDEIYAFAKFRMDNQVVLRCADDKRPVSWYREEGSGRVFYTALGHSNESWSQPPLVSQHVLPGMLWAMKR